LEELKKKIEEKDDEIQDIKKNVIAKKDKEILDLKNQLKLKEKSEVEKDEIIKSLKSETHKSSEPTEDFTTTTKEALEKSVFIPTFELKWNNEFGCPSTAVDFYQFLKKMKYPNLEMKIVLKFY